MAWVFVVVKERIMSSSTIISFNVIAQNMYFPFVHTQVAICLSVTCVISALLSEHREKEAKEEVDRYYEEKIKSFLLRITSQKLGSFGNPVGNFLGPIMDREEIERSYNKLKNIGEDKVEHSKVNPETRAFIEEHIPQFEKRKSREKFWKYGKIGSKIINAVNIFVFVQNIWFFGFNS